MYHVYQVQEIVDYLFVKIYNILFPKPDRVLNKEFEIIR